MEAEVNSLGMWFHLSFKFVTDRSCFKNRKREQNKIDCYIFSPSTTLNKPIPLINY